MKTRVALVCLGPAAKGVLEIRAVPRRDPAADEVEVAVEAASVNPIDVRRAAGYGSRLLSLLGAGRFPSRNHRSSRAKTAIGLIAS